VAEFWNPTGYEAQQAAGAVAPGGAIRLLSAVAN
jgi:hypothetical protein